MVVYRGACVSGLQSCNGQRERIISETTGELRLPSYCLGTNGHRCKCWHYGKGEGDANEGEEESTNVSAVRYGVVLLLVS